MIEPSNLAEQLWALFTDEIATGEPVFFCFSQETLKDKLAGLASESPLHAICRAARSCYDIDGQWVSLRRNSLARNENGWSNAILLVCQQILAVEEMAREGGRYSENAYFPRLRALMAAELPIVSMNPFRFREFELIWRAFAREVRSINGSNSHTITFEFETYSGMNKARHFPLSQALLSRADLTELMRRCSLERLRKGASRDVWAEVRQNRHHLSRRAQQLINNGFLKDRISEQVQKYAGREFTKPPVNESLKQRSDTLELAIAMDATDWFSPEYVALLLSPDDTVRTDDDQQVGKRLRELLASSGHVFCALSDFGDCWRFRDGVVEVKPDDTVLLVATQEGILTARAALLQVSPTLTVTDSSVKRLGGTSKVLICPVHFPPTLMRTVTIRNGQIGREGLTTTKVEDYEWIGGICLDRRSKKYLKEGLPRAVRFGIEEFPIDQVVRVGDLALRWRSVQGNIQRLDTDAVYELGFPNGRSARLAIGVVAGGTTERMGYPIDQDGRLAPTLIPLDGTELAVTGFSCPAEIPVKPIAIGTIAKLIADLRNKRGRVLTEQESSAIWIQVNASTIPSNVKGAIKKLLAREATISAVTLAEIFSPTLAQ